MFQRDNVEARVERIPPEWKLLQVGDRIKSSIGPVCISNSEINGGILKTPEEGSVLPFSRPRIQNVSPGRKRSRKVSCRVLDLRFEEENLALQKIGKLTDQRRHSTVNHESRLRAST